MANNIKLRRFQAGDEEGVRNLINGIMGAEFREAQSAYPTHDLDDIEKAYGNIGDAFFVAHNGPKVIGTVAIKKEDEREALLRRLFVAPEYRHRKLGDQLIDRALEFCREVGYHELVFKTTSQMQGAIRLCQKKGFLQRAKIDLGNMELLKFTLPIQEKAKPLSSS